MSYLSGLTFGVVLGVQPVALPSPCIWLEILVWQNPGDENRKFRGPSDRKIEELSLGHNPSCSSCLLLSPQNFHEPGDPQVEPVRAKDQDSYRLPIPDHMTVRLSFCHLIECRLFPWPTTKSRPQSYAAAYVQSVPPEISGDRDLILPPVGFAYVYLTLWNDPEKFFKVPGKSFAALSPQPEEKTQPSPNPLRNFISSCGRNDDVKGEFRQALDKRIIKETEARLQFFSN